MTHKISRIDSNGRVYIPKGLRNAAGLEQADFVKLGFNSGSVTVKKVLLIEQGDQSPEARAELVRAHVRMMSKDEIYTLAKYIANMEETK